MNAYYVEVIGPRGIIVREVRQEADTYQAACRMVARRIGANERVGNAYRAND